MRQKYDMRISPIPIVQKSVEEEERGKGQSGYSINLKSILLLRLRFRKDGIQRGLLISSFDVRYD